MPAADAHPSLDELEAFCQGTLAEPLCRGVEAHLCGCPVCQQRAAEMPGDTFVTLLRSVRDNDKTVTNTPGQGATESVTSAWGTPAEQPDAVPPAELADHPRYRLIRLLGSGGMGTVWLAEHKVMGRMVALKLIRPDFLTKPGAIERFRREVKAAARLHHPNIVAAHDADQAGQTHFLVMEYLDGENLADRVARGGPLMIADACRAVYDAALGLQHAHKNGLIHRDLKPHNLMRSADGTVKVLDFGLAVVAETASSGLTGSNMVVGTPDYIAPEQAEDSRSADFRSDIYSLGCTLYCLLTGRVPFPGNSTLRKLDDHRRRDPDPVRTLRPEVPIELAQVVARMMAKEPAARYQSATEVTAALEPFCETRGAGSTSDQRLSSSGRSRSRLAVVAVLVFALLLAAGAIYRIQTDRGELQITTESDDVEVVIKQSGEVIRIIDTKTEKSITLRSGEYELELKGAPEGLKLDVDKAILMRGKTVLARVERKSKPAVVEKIQEIRRFEGHTGGVGEVTLSPDGRLALTGGSEFVLRLWDTETGKELRKFEGHTSHIHSPTFLPDGKRFLSASRDGTVRLWDVETGKELRQLEGHTDQVWGLDVSSDGKLALTGCHDKLMRLWDVETGKEIRRFEGHTEGVASVAFSPDGKQALSASDDKTVRLWELATGKELRRLENATPARRVVFSSDGRLALLACIEEGDGRGRVVLWDVAAWKEVRRFNGHKGTAYVAVFTPDGRQVLSAGLDGYVRLWDIASGRELDHIKDDGEIFGLAIGRDGRHFLTNGGYTKVPKLYRLPGPPPLDKPIRPVRLPNAPREKQP